MLLSVGTLSSQTLVKSSKCTYDKTLITSILELISGISIFSSKFFKLSIVDTVVL